MKCYTEILFSEQIACLALPEPENGRIEYSSGSTGDQLFGVTAMYICESGFGLTGGERVRTCEGDGNSPVGTWTGNAPSCLGNFIQYCMLLHACISVH